MTKRTQSKLRLRRRCFVSSSCKVDKFSKASLSYYYVPQDQAVRLVLGRHFQHGFNSERVSFNT